MLAPPLKPVESLLFSGDVAAVGSFRCPASHPLFRDSGPCSSHTFVFPRTMTRIRHAEGTSFVGTPNTVSFYNRDQHYSREPISGTDASDWYVVANDVLLDVLSQYDPAAFDRPARPFRFAHGPSDPRTYVEQRQLFARLERGEAVDRLAVEEQIVALLDRVVAAALAVRRDKPSRGARDRAEGAKLAVAANVTRLSTLRELARAAECSPFQLCRDFRTVTGQSITAYRHSLRMRLALERLRDRKADLTDLALDLGYSSHSHFTFVFRRTFGMTPSRFRDEA
jgi:AraC family transcriptional regulator